MKIIKTYESYNNLKDLDLGKFENKISKYKLTLNEDGSYDYNGDLDLTSASLNLKSLTEIPIRLRTVFGDFDCSWSFNFTSLEGSPERIIGDFNCSSNDLISLQYAPLEVSGKFRCWNNLLLSQSCELLSKKNFNEIDLSSNPFEITNEVIKAVSKMTFKQQMSELDYFKKNDENAFEMMKEILDGLKVFYGEETRKMVDVVDKDYTNAKNLF